MDLTTLLFYWVALRRFWVIWTILQSIPVKLTRSIATGHWRSSNVTSKFQDSSLAIRPWGDHENIFRVLNGSNGSGSQHKFFPSFFQVDDMNTIGTSLENVLHHLDFGVFRSKVGCSSQHLGDVSLLKKQVNKWVYNFRDLKQTRTTERRIKRFMSTRHSDSSLKKTDMNLFSAKVKSSSYSEDCFDLLAKALYEFDFFWRSFVRIGKSIRRITWLFCTSALSSLDSISMFFSGV